MKLFVNRFIALVIDSLLIGIRSELLKWHFR